MPDFVVSNEGHCIAAVNLATANLAFSNMSATERQSLCRVEEHRDSKPLRVGGTATFVMPCGARWSARKLSEAISNHERAFERKVSQLARAIFVPARPAARGTAAA